MSVRIDSKPIEGDCKFFGASCRGLMAGIIDQAVRDFISWRIGGGSKCYGESAQNWIFGEENQGASNSFVTVCGIIDLDPDRVRDALVEKIVDAEAGKRILNTRKRGRGLSKGALHG